MSVSKALKKIAFWSNRANDAYSMGEACPHGHRYEDCCWRGSLPPGGTKEGT